jgi:hypothetical protein
MAKVKETNATSAARLAINHQTVGGSQGEVDLQTDIP